MNRHIKENRCVGWRSGGRLLRPGRRKLKPQFKRIALSGSVSPETAEVMEVWRGAYALRNGAIIDSMVAHCRKSKTFRLPTK